MLFLYIDTCLRLESITGIVNAIATRIAVKIFKSSVFNPICNTTALLYYLLLYLLVFYIGSLEQS